ncbi:cytidylate kinase-like family protein [Treponema pectinovorum]|uniref:cytidylate kinase-like family protein n=1 Tax=Treponema pectinovorum TaxID=164 RepID=UPI0011C748B0|nr:cytidylate kinase-like family protein [Treponema pectinovorum]
MNKIITISREFGAGGGEIGKRVAQILGFEYYDKGIILKAASEINMDIAKVLKNDEKAPFLSTFTQTLFDFYSTPVNEQIFEAQKSVIRKIAEHGKCVIVGRNANRILSQFDSALHIFVHADVYWRVNRLKAEKMQDVAESKIMQELEKVDKMRHKYCSYYTNTEFGDSRYYDVCLNTSKISIDDCVKLIVNLSK